MCAHRPRQARNRSSLRFRGRAFPRHPFAVSSAPQPLTAQHSPPGWASTFNLSGSSSSVHIVRGCRPLRAYREVRAHIAPRKLAAAAPTAFHPRSSWAANEIEGGVLLKLPHTNLTLALATALRHTITAERQTGAVVLRKVNVLASVQTDVSSASRMAGVIEQPVFGRGILQLFQFTAGFERKPAFPSRWRGPGSIAGGLRRVWVRAIWACTRRLAPMSEVLQPQPHFIRGHGGPPRLAFELPPVGPCLLVA
jgi:hypothetical protein